MKMIKWLVNINEQINEFTEKAVNRNLSPTMNAHKNWDVSIPADRQEILEFLRQPGVAAKSGITCEEIQALENLHSKQQKLHLEQEQTVTADPVLEPVDDQTLEEIVAELNDLIGLESVKEEVNTLINFIKIQKEREALDLKNSKISYHCVFTGSPGTGKTTVARLVTKIYKHLGVLNKGHLVETDRSGLVAEYSGQTSVKVNKLVDSALDGILFIDEAYSLVGDGQDDFGREAVATLLKRMEDNRDRLVLVLAGYQKDMTDFINTNPGLKSRFNKYIEFPDYTPVELMKIFQLFCNKSEYKIDTKAKKRLNEMFQALYDDKDEQFGNGRLVRNTFEQTMNLINVSTFLLM